MSTIRPHSTYHKVHHYQIFSRFVVFPDVNNNQLEPDLDDSDDEFSSFIKMAEAATKRLFKLSGFSAGYVSPNTYSAWFEASCDIVLRENSIPEKCPKASYAGNRRNAFYSLVHDSRGL